MTTKCDIVPKLLLETRGSTCPPTRLCLSPPPRLPRPAHNHAYKSTTTNNNNNICKKNSNCLLLTTRCSVISFLLLLLLSIHQFNLKLLNFCDASMQISQQIRWQDKVRPANVSKFVIDDTTNSIYLGATNWLFQVSLESFQLEFALRTGPVPDSPRLLDCAPAECVAPMSLVDTQSVPFATSNDIKFSKLSQSSRQKRASQQHFQLQAHLSSHAPLANNYNKLLLVDSDARQLLACSSLSHGACRRHQLGNLANFSELIPVPVAANDESLSTVGLIAQQYPSGSSIGSGRALFVAATHAKSGAYRDAVPAISARYLDNQRSMQIIEQSLGSARVDISFELRDYYTVSYVHAFEYGGFVYFATIQRKSPLLAEEELGYETRLARICAGDTTMQSYVEMSLECKSGRLNTDEDADAGMLWPLNEDDEAVVDEDGSEQQQVYNLMQDAIVVDSSDLSFSPSSSSSLSSNSNNNNKQKKVLIASFAQSKDHSNKPTNKSAICAFHLQDIESKFSENIKLCTSGKQKSQNMNYIAGSVSECPLIQLADDANFCSEPLKLNSSLPLISSPIVSFSSELITAVSATSVQTSQRNPNTRHLVLVIGTASGSVRRLVVTTNNNNNNNNISGSDDDNDDDIDTGSGSKNSLYINKQQQQRHYTTRAVEFDSIQVSNEPIIKDFELWPKKVSSNSNAQYAIVANQNGLAKIRINQCNAKKLLQGNESRESLCNSCSQLGDPFCGWCAPIGSCVSLADCETAMRNSLDISTSSSSNPSNNNDDELVNNIDAWFGYKQIECSKYAPLTPAAVSRQQLELANTATGQVFVDVNIELQTTTSTSTNLQTLSEHLAKTKFVCITELQDSDGNAIASSMPMDIMSSSYAGSGGSYLRGQEGDQQQQQQQQQSAVKTSSALRARLDVSAAIVSVACPIVNNLPQANSTKSVKIILSLPTIGANNIVDRTDQQIAEESERVNILRQLLNMKQQRKLLDSQNAPVVGGGQSARNTDDDDGNDSSLLQLELANSYYVERQLQVFDCSTFSSSCNQCSSAGKASHQSAKWSCAWNANTNECVAADKAINSQKDMCSSNVGGSTGHRRGSGNQVVNSKYHSTTTNNNLPTGKLLVYDQQSAVIVKNSIVIASNSRKSISVELIAIQSQANKRLFDIKMAKKVECVFVVEGTLLRLPATIQQQSTTTSTTVMTNNNNNNNNNNKQLTVVCQESQFGYKRFVSQLDAKLSVVINTKSVVAETIVTLYKCHLFGISPRAPLIETLHASESDARRAFEAIGQQYHHQHVQHVQQFNTSTNNGADCSQCRAIDRKFRCSWCELSSMCLPSEQCIGTGSGFSSSMSSCPPPRIFSIKPTSGPIEGGTFVTIEGSDLATSGLSGQNVFIGESCEVVLHSASNRIVCKTAASKKGQHLSTVFVGNSASVSQASEPFSLKAIHLADVKPRFGPISGGTRITLSGSNLNVGSIINVSLDGIPCRVLRYSAQPTTTTSSTQTQTQTQQIPSQQTTNLVLTIDNYSAILPLAFTYLPDPLITSIEPVESFASGGRLLLISGQNLASTSTNKLILLDEITNKPISYTNCTIRNNMLITCLSPSLATRMRNEQQQDNKKRAKFKFQFEMDGVKSAKAFHQYYHHLPNYLTYLPDPKLIPFEQQIVEYNRELVINGQNLDIKNLSEDIYLTIGSKVCPIKSLTSNSLSCEPPSYAPPPTDEFGRLTRRQLPAIVALIGSNLRFELGYMQYPASMQTSQSIYQQPTTTSNNLGGQSNFNFQDQVPTIGSSEDQAFINPNNLGIDSLTQDQQDIKANNNNSTSFASIALIVFVFICFCFGIGLSFVFAMAKFKSFKAEREYKRIQMQMGTVDGHNSSICVGSNSSSRIVVDICGRSIALRPNITTLHANKSRINNHLHLQQKQNNFNEPLVDCKNGNSTPLTFSSTGKRLLDSQFIAANTSSCNSSSGTSSQQLTPNNTTNNHNYNYQHNNINNNINQQQHHQQQQQQQQQHQQQQFSNLSSSETYFSSSTCSKPSFDFYKYNNI